MLLNIDKTRLLDFEVYLLSGRIVLGRSCEELERMLDAELAGGQRKFIWDLTEVARIDSAGIGILVRSAGKISAAGGLFRVCGATGVVAEIVETTKIAQIISFYPDLEAASREIGSGAASA